MTEVAVDTIVASVQLGQARPADPAAVSLYTLPANTRTKVTSVVICNTTGSAVSVRLFHSLSGTTYDATTALLYDVVVDANTSASFDPSDLWLENTSGNIAVSTGTNSALTFTMYGMEYQKTVTVN